MNSYRVAATGEPRDKLGNHGRLFHVDITVLAHDDMDAHEKAVAYLRRVYEQADWRVDAVNQLVTPRPPTRRKPKLIEPRRNPRR